jgi:hypothetical protein
MNSLGRIRAWTGEYLSRRKDMKRLRQRLKASFVDRCQAGTRLIRFRFVDSQELYEKHKAFGCDSMTLRSEYRDRWISIIAEDVVSGQIVFATSVFLFRPGDPVTFWSPVPDSEQYRQVPLSSREWYKGGKVISIGYTLSSQSKFANVIPMESILRINDHFRRNLNGYLLAFGEAVKQAAAELDAELLLEPHGKANIPLALTYFPSVNVHRPSGPDDGENTRNESKVVEQLCRTYFRIPMRNDVVGLYSMSNVFFGKPS